MFECPVQNVLQRISVAPKFCTWKKNLTLNYIVFLSTQINKFDVFENQLRKPLENHTLLIFVKTLMYSYSYAFKRMNAQLIFSHKMLNYLNFYYKCNQEKHHRHSRSQMLCNTFSPSSLYKYVFFSVVVKQYEQTGDNLRMYKYRQFIKTSIHVRVANC